MKIGPFPPVVASWKRWSEVSMKTASQTSWEIKHIGERCLARGGERGVSAGVNEHSCLEKSGAKKNWANWEPEH